MTVPGLGAVGSGGSGVPGSVEKGRRNELEHAEGWTQSQAPHTHTELGTACSGRVDE